MVEGESINSLAKEFGVVESVIRRKIKPNKAEQEKFGKSLSVLAFEKVEADKKSKAIAEHIAELPMVRQTTFNDLTEQLRSISSHLAGAANFGAATSHRLAGIAHAKVQEIDDAAPLSPASIEALKGVAALTRLANDAASTGLNLLAANKDQAKAQAPEVPTGLGFLYGETSDDKAGA